MADKLSKSEWLAWQAQKRELLRALERDTGLVFTPLKCAVNARLRCKFCGNLFRAADNYCFDEATAARCEHRRVAPGTDTPQ